MGGTRLGALVLAGGVLATPLHAQSWQPFLPLGEADSARWLPSDPQRDEGRRTLNAFGSNLGRNFAGVFSRANLAPLLIGASLTAGGSRLDAEARSHLLKPSATLAASGDRLGGPIVMLPAVGALFLAGRLSEPGTFRSASYDMAQAVVVNLVYTEVLKRTVGRHRPDASDNLSFPSGHTSNAFALATVANAHFGAKVGIPAYLAAGAIGFSRIEKDAHNLSDVLAGAVVGYIVGRTVVRQDGRVEKGKAHFEIVPAAPPSGAGAGAGISIDW